MEITVKYDPYDIHKLIQATMEHQGAKLLSAAVRCLNNWPSASYVSANCRVLTPQGSEAHSEIENNDIFALIFLDLEHKGLSCEQFTVAPNNTHDAVQDQFAVEVTGVSWRQPSAEENGSE